MLLPASTTVNFLYQDDDFVVIDKISGHYVHPPQDEYYTKNPAPRSLICLYHVRNILKQKVYPVHRLDVATSGILIFAKSSEVASALCRQFAARQVKKTYKAVVRGYTTEQGQIDIPLDSHSQASLVPATTTYKRLGSLELPFAVGKYPTSRYSLVEVSPHTGRYHQIRRHFNRISHPVIGDGTHGDSRHNTFFRETLGIPSLCLRAHRISFQHPRTLEDFSLEAPNNEKWQKLEALAWNFTPAAQNIDDQSPKGL